MRGNRSEGVGLAVLVAWKTEPLRLDFHHALTAPTVTSVISELVTSLV